MYHFSETLTLVHKSSKPTHDTPITVLFKLEISVKVVYITIDQTYFV